MTNEENEQIPKIEVMAPSDVDESQAHVVLGDEDKETERPNAVEEQVNVLSKSEPVQEEEPIESHQPVPEARVSGGIGPSEHTSESEAPVSESYINLQHTGIGPSDNVEISEMPAEYADTSTDRNKKPKMDLNISSGNSRAAIKGMLSFFTIKKQDVGQMEMDAMDSNFHLVPLVGVVFGAVLMIEMFLLFLLNYYVSFPLGPIIAITVLGTVLIGSKFLHFDGLVDFGDGMVASGNQAKHITAMKDTNIGAGGLGLALIVMLATLAIYSVGNNWNDLMFFALFFIIPATEILIKNSMACAAAMGTPGEGMASNQVKKADTDTMLKSTGLSAILLIVGLIFTTVILSIMNWVHLRYWADPLIGNFSFFIIALFASIVIGLVVSMVVGIMMSKLADRTFGATTGDVLGATNEIARPFVSAAMLLFFLIMMTILIRI